jgi:hypothetical protein
VEVFCTASRWFRPLRQRPSQDPLARGNGAWPLRHHLDRLTPLPRAGVIICFHTFSPSLIADPWSLPARVRVAEGHGQTSSPHLHLSVQGHHGIARTLTRKVTAKVPVSMLPSDVFSLRLQDVSTSPFIDLCNSCTSSTLRWCM